MKKIAMIFSIEVFLLLFFFLSTGLYSAVNERVIYSNSAAERVEDYVKSQREGRLMRASYIDNGDVCFYKSVDSLLKLHKMVKDKSVFSSNMWFLLMVYCILRNVFFLTWYLYKKHQLRHRKKELETPAVLG